MDTVVDFQNELFMTKEASEKLTRIEMRYAIYWKRTKYETETPAHLSTQFELSFLTAFVFNLIVWKIVQNL